MPHRVNVPAFSAWLYRYRNLVERFFNELKHSRASMDALYESVTYSRLASLKPVEPELADGFQGDREQQGAGAIVAGQ
jgi:hypothetical protein